MTGTTSRYIPILSVALLACGVLSAEDDGRAIIKVRGQTARVVDSVRYDGVAREYVFTQGGVTFRAVADQVEQVRSSKPVEWEAAVRQKDTAVLERMAAANARLGWDAAAYRLLVTFYAESGRAPEAVRAYRRLKEVATGVDDGLRETYLRALARADHAALRRELASLGSSSRPLAALAGILRGDLDMADGKPREALTDGYLRTVLLYPDVTVLRREALGKSAAVLEHLGDPRAARLRALLVKSTPPIRG